MPTYTHNDQNIRVEFRAIGMLLWLFAGIVVRVGDRTFWPRLDGISFTTATDFEMVIEGERVPGIVRSLGPIWFRPRAMCSVVVGDVEIAREFLPFRLWALCYLMWAVLAFGVVLSLLGVWVFVIAIRYFTHAA